MSRRTKNFLLLSLACWLLLGGVILWHLFASETPTSPSQPTITPVEHQQSTLRSGGGLIPTPTPPPERVVHFPEDRSIGALYVRDWDSWIEGLFSPVSGDPRQSEWRILGDAQGVSVIPPGLSLALWVNAEYVQDLSPLTALKSDDLQELYINPHRRYGENPLTRKSTIVDEHLRDLAGLTSLRHLELRGAILSENGMEQIKGLTSLRRLILNGAQVDDESLEHLRGMIHLRKLNLSDTQVTDEGLKSISNLSSLEFIDLHGTQVTDSGLLHLVHLPSLRRLRIDRISDEGLNHIGKLESLEILMVSGPLITGAGISQLQPLTSLRYLFLSKTSITNLGLASLGSMTELEYLWIEGSEYINDAGLEYLATLRKLEFLILQDCKNITSDGLAQLQWALPDCQIGPYDN